MVTTTSRGIPIVTDLQFWTNDDAWEENRSFLLQQNALLKEGVDVFELADTLEVICPTSACYSLDVSEIGLVVIGGFHPHHLMPAVVQALSHQLPHSDILMLYASRDTPPDFQDRNLLHMQAWTADVHSGYVIRAGCPGRVGGFSRCHSPETMSRGIDSDPTLVKVSAFTHSLANVQVVGAQISPAGTVQAMLNKGRHVLFCCEGDASLACSCLRPPPPPIVHELPMPYRYFTDDGRIETYDSFIQREMAQWRCYRLHTDDCVYPNSAFYREKLQRAAYQWAQAWPTVHRSQHQFCGCLRSSMTFPWWLDLLVDV